MFVGGPEGMQGRWFPLISTGAVALIAAGSLVWFVTGQREVGHLPPATAVDRAPLEREEPGRPSAARPPLAAGRVWRPVDEGSAGELPPFEDGWSREGRVLVDVSAAISAAPGWRVGDRLALDLPQAGARFESTIERITEGADGSRSVRGWIEEDDGGRHRFVVTVGPLHVFAYVDTARGSYELVGGNRLGWLLPTSSLLAGWDFSKTDVVMPEPDGTVPDAR